MMMQPMMMKIMAPSSVPPLMSMSRVENLMARFDWMATAMMMPMA